MEPREQIRQWADWPGWRRHAPAAGSVVAHGVVGLAIVSLMAASVAPAPPGAKPLAEAITVELMADSLPILPLPKPAPGPRTSREKEPTLPTPSSSTPDPRKGPATVPQIATEAPSGGADSVYVPSPFATQRPTGGLQGLANIDPCAARKSLRPKDCTNWVAKVGAMDSMVPRSQEELAQQHGAFMPKCQWAVGCEEQEWISTNGTRSVAGTRMAGGVESVGGITDTVGRLGFNPDHFDRGFGN